MNKRKRMVEVGILCILFLFMAAYAESSEHRIDRNNQVIRASPGESSRKLKVQMDAGDVLKNYDYQLDIPAVTADREEADRCFIRAREEIDQRFYADGDSAEHVSHPVVMEDTYADGRVEAEWTLDSYQYMDVDGNLREELPEEEAIIQASVLLTCDAYEEEYIFSFRLVSGERSPEEQLLADIERAIAEEGSREGRSYFQLPDEVDGIRLSWSEPKQHLVIKVFFFEIVIVVLLGLTVKERKETQRKMRQEQMQLDYAEFVNKLLILLGSGMSLKQSLNRISARYIDKREKKQTHKRYLYEELLITTHEMQDGESERNAYRKFGERTGLSCYHRLVRILIQNLQTGNRGLCELLGQEADNALQERKALARKLAEEAQTKMLLPLILMLGIVIAIIMVPAIQLFKV